MSEKFKNIIIASDLDGTFFDDRMDVVPKNLEKIKYFLENGGYFTFSTGRVPEHIFARIPAPEQILNLPTVTGNGTCLYDFLTGRAVEEHFLPYEAVADLADFLAGNFPDTAMRASTDRGTFAYDESNPYIREDMIKIGVTEGYRPLSEWKNYGMYKLGIRGDADRLSVLRARLERRYEDVFEVTASVSTLLDIQKKGRTKAVMLQEMVEAFFPKGSVLCTVGDYDNDLEMHAIADLPVCPANANDRVKEVCSLCLCSNNDGVIADLIDYLDTYDVSHLASEKKTKK